MQKNNSATLRGLALAGNLVFSDHFHLFFLSKLISILIFSLVPCSLLGIVCPNYVQTYEPFVFTEFSHHLYHTDCVTYLICFFLYSLLFHPLGFIDFYTICAESILRSQDRSRNVDSF